VSNALRNHDPFWICLRSYRFDQHQSLPQRILVLLLLIEGVARTHENHPDWSGCGLFGSALRDDLREDGVK